MPYHEYPNYKGSGQMTIDEFMMEWVKRPDTNVREPPVYTLIGFIQSKREKFVVTLPYKIVRYLKVGRSLWRLESGSEPVDITNQFRKELENGQ